jgi:hypothetical protein
VPRYDDAVRSDQDRIGPAELGDGGSYLGNLLGRMGTRVARVRDEPVNWPGLDLREIAFHFKVPFFRFDVAATKLVA